MARKLKFFWIDAVESWSSSAQSNLSILAKKYDIDLKIDTAINGEDIAQKLMLFEYDAVVMDYHMEPFRGDKYIADIRGEEHLSNIPILFYSQDSTSDLSALVAGFNRIIVVYRPNLEDKIREIFNIGNWGSY